MALLDFFKKKPVKKPPLKPRGIKQKKEEKQKPVVKAPEVKIEKRREIKTDTAYKIFREPHVSEKATDLAEKNQYIFRVFSEANKVEIKRAVEDFYGVDVVEVRIINVHPKSRRVGKTKGFKKGYKKAIVRIMGGQTIEVLPR